MQNFGVEQQFQKIKEEATRSVKQVFPVKGRNRSIELERVHVDDSHDPADYSSQAKAKKKDGTWGASVYADLTMTENSSGKTLDRASKIKLFTLPKLTTRRSYIVKGNEYQVSNQLRLKPGAYTKRSKNGSLKTQVNVDKGKSFTLRFLEDDAVFQIEGIGGSQSKIPLYPILTHLGVSPGIIAKKWGDKIAAANRGAGGANAVSRAKTAFGAKQNEELKDVFERTRLSPDTTNTTLGKSFDRVSGPMLLAASKKLLDTHLGKTDPDDRDSLEFKELWSVEDFLSERLSKSKDLAFKIRRGLNNPKRTKITEIVNPGGFNSTVESFFTQDDKSAAPDQTNPLEMLTGSYSTTIMGSGGLSSRHQITNEVREVHPTHYGFMDPLHTPESGKIGTNLHLPLGAVKDGKEVKMVVTKKPNPDGKSETTTLTPKQAFDKKIAFPGQKGDRIEALHKGKKIEVGRDEVDYYTPRSEALFSWSSNLVPYLPSNQGNRAMMAAKMMEQAIPLKNREEPLVQVAASGDKSFEEIIASSGKEKGLAVRAPADGVVKKVAEDHLILKTAQGDKKVNLYNNFSLNRKSFINHEVKVKKGDQVKEGDLLADSNFTKNGTLSLGTNLRTGYLPYKGLNFEDGVVISDSAANKLTSEHIHKKTLDLGPTTIQGLGKFRAFQPNALSPANSKKLDKDGVIKKGETVEQGDIVIAALKKRSANQNIAKINRALSDRPKNVSVTWTQEENGVVQDVQRQRGKITVFIKTEEKAKVGDKLSGRMGNKGIITKILPDEQAPKNKDGEHVEVLMNPHGVISRINIGQIYESAAGKAAKKKGRPLKIQNFSGEDYLDSTKKILKENGVDDKEELFDPDTGKSIGNVHVGNPYILKLSKQSTSNFSVRQGGAGHPYDADRQPLKAGGEEGAKALDVLTMNSLLAHGSRANLREMSTQKGDQNEEFWEALKSGQQLPPPKQTFAYNKFLGKLKGAGINVEKDGSKMTLAPLTDDQVGKLSSMKVDKPQFFRAKDMKEIPGGFLDPQKLGGFEGEKWGHMELKEPVVNPVFEKAVKRITGIGKKFDSIMDGKLHLDENGELNSEGRGVTSGKAIEKLLKDIDVDEQIKTLSKKGETAKGSNLDSINKKLKTLNSLKQLDMRPEEAYLRKKVPIVPPKFRPVYQLDDGNITTSGVNILYQNAAVLNQMSKSEVMDLLPEDEKSDLRKDMYRYVKGITGLTDINVRGREREGFIQDIHKGGSQGQPKEGYFISKLLSKKQDYVGRGTIIPEPDLGMDEMAMPEEMAWKLFEPFVIKDLKSAGRSPLKAKEEVKNRTKLAKKSLENVMEKRNVMLNRAPSLHKHSIMSFKPKMTTGKALKIPPLVVEGFNADFDGDTMTVHVPVSDEANKEAEQMRPSRNLFKPGTGKLMNTPSQEAQVGLYYLSKDEEGRDKLNKLLGKKYAIDDVLDKKTTKNLLNRMAREMDPEDFGETVRKLKSAGEDKAYFKGFTLGLEDLEQFRGERDKVVGKAKEALKKAKTEEEVAKINEDAGKFIDQTISKRLKGKDNPLYDMVESGARGKMGQLRQMLASPLFVTDAKGDIVKDPIEKSYSEGLPIDDYWSSMYGARRGMIDRAVQTSEPGAFSKEVMALSLDNVISSEDCGVKEGTSFKLTDPDLAGRYLAKDQHGYARNTLVDQKLINDVKRKKVQSIEARSPLSCLQSQGTCAYCYGNDEQGELPDVGDNVGAKAGQTISEPLVQMIMETFHSGGTAGTGADAKGYERIGQLLKLPKKVEGAAPLAPASGKVEKIQKGAGGGYNVYVAGKRAYVPHGRKLKVKEGDQVEKGDALSTGPMKPQDIAQYKGMREAQEYIVDELQKSYHEQNVPIERKAFETITRSLGNFTQVTNNPKHSDHFPGDVIPLNEAENFNKSRYMTVPVEECSGYELAEDLPSLKKGKELGDNDVKLLKGMGKEEVRVAKEPVKHKPVLKGMSSVPMMRQDWMAALGYQNLAEALTEGASQGWKTDTSGYHPVPAFAQGSTFGKGKEGRY